MSEVKRYNPELEKDIGLGLPCLSMLGNPYGEWVHYQDYAELKAQRDELEEKLARSQDWSIGVDSERMEYIEKCNMLAAENATLLDFDIDEFRDAGPYQPDDSILGKLKTPATDAYLNSVRAEGVASFAHHQRVIADATPEHGCQRGRRFAAGLAEDFAAQLRAGEPS